MKPTAELLEDICNEQIEVYIELNDGSHLIGHIESVHTGPLSLRLQERNGGSRFLFPWRSVNVLRRSHELDGVPLA